MAPCRNLLGFLSRKPQLSPTQTSPDQAAVKDGDEAYAVGAPGLPSSGKKRGRPARQCVRPVPIDLGDAGIDADDEERVECGVKGSGGGKGKKTPRKTSTTPSKRNRRKDATDKGNGDSHTAIDFQRSECIAPSPEKTGADFFVKFSEKKTRRRSLQKELRETTNTGEQQLKENKWKDCEFAILESNCPVESSNNNSNYSSPVKAIDLRSEAKKAAEENARLFAGKQIHPFFVTRQPSRRLLDANHLDGESHSFPQVDTFLPSVPLHVLQTTPEDELPLCWTDWMFAVGDMVNGANPVVPESTTFSSLYDVHPLKLDSVYDAPGSPKSMLPEPLLDRIGSSLTASTSSSVLIHHQTTIHLEAHGQSSDDTRKNLLYGEEGNKRFHIIYFLLRQDESYYLRCRSCQSDFNLWIDKYQPVFASEVCGNSDSVNFIKEWLHSWCIQNEDKKEPFDKSQCSIDDGDHDWVGDDDTLINMEENALRNLLLLTGPVGCGKSAAIYACAKEQGFQIIEISASDWRSGTLVRQKFQEAMESECLKKWSNDDHACSQERHDSEIFLTEPKSAEGTVVESILRSSCNGIEVRQTGSQSGMKTLILFEDFDTIFDEDRGLLKTILDLAETAKRPIILTSNSGDPALPSGMDLPTVRFILPSKDELIFHAEMVCASEAIDVPPQLIERVVKCCQYDIRKTLMFLQFWCQGERDPEANHSSCVYGSLPFNINSAHHVIPSVVPWGFPSKLSAHIDQEISKSLADMEAWLEDKTISEDAIAEENITALYENQNQNTGMYQEGSLSIRNCTMQGRDLELSLLSDDISPSKYVDTTKQSRNKRRIVLSDSEDELLYTGEPDLSERHQYLVEDSAVDGTSNFFPMELSPKLDDPGMELDLLRGLKVNEDPFHVSNGSPITSCIPEVSFVAETKVDADEYVEQTSSYCFLDNMHRDYVDSAHTMNIEAKLTNHTKTDEELDMASETMYGSTCAIAAESVFGFEDSHLEAPSMILRQCPLIDECSRAGFRLGSMTKESLKCSTPVDLVQQSWKDLRSQGVKIKSCMETEHNACSSLKIASKPMELICNADVMLGAGHMLDGDIYDHNHHLDLVSTFAEHGFCFYVKECTPLRRHLGTGGNFDIPWEVLSSSKDGLAVGKLITQESRNDSYIRLKHKKVEDVPSDRIERNLLLSNATLSSVPTRAYLASRGAAFHEYLSFLSQISKSESARLTQADQSRRYGRRRGSRHHYLMAGSFSMSAEDIILLDQHACYKKDVSKSGES